MVLCILFVTFWDIIWVSFTDIEPSYFEAENLGLFDQVMFQGEMIFSWIIYYMVIVSGPIDICRMYMLRENKRIYALLICFTGGIKLGIQGLFINEVISWVDSKQFIYQRFFAIILNLMGISALIIIVRDELGEIFRQQLVNPKQVSTYGVKSSNTAITVSDSSKKFDVSVRSFNNQNKFDSFANLNLPKVKRDTDAGYLSYKI